MTDTEVHPSPLLSERLISFAQAARLIPPSRQGRPVSPSCIWRWHRSGVKTPDGRIVRLEALKLVHRFVTTEEAVRRFIAGQQPDDQPASAVQPASQTARRRTDAGRQRSSEAALLRLRGSRT